MKKLITPIIAIVLFLAAYSQTGDSTVTPVTGLHTLKGEYDKSTTTVSLSWTTFTETNNSGFVIYDGKDSVGFVKSRAVSGTSATQIPYGVKISYPKRLVVEFGFPIVIALLMASLLLFKRNRRLIVGIAAIGFFSFASCNKDGSMAIDKSSHTYHIVQYDIDKEIGGTSPTIKVIFN